MKYAIISDIHANLKALELLLSDIEDQGCSHLACLGDIVGRGEQPKECVDLFRKRRNGLPFLVRPMRRATRAISPSN